MVKPTPSKAPVIRMRLLAIPKSTLPVTFEARNNADAALAIIRAADPVADTDVVTKKYLETSAHVVVVGEIYDLTGTATFAPVSPAAGNIYIATDTVGVYAAGKLYRYDGSAWTEVSRFAGMKIAVTIALTEGADTYSADHIYLWDVEGAAFVDIGPSVSSVTKVVKTVRAELLFGTGSPLNVGAEIPAGSRCLQAIVSVTTPFNGTAPTLLLGIAGDTDAIAAAAEIDLKTAGVYIIDCYVKNAGSTQLIATYTADSSSAGAADIEVEYSIQ
jgi:hypothetical protein